MAEVKHIGDLQIGEDMQFQHRAWALQRVGWAVMLLIIVAALLGIFGGDGPLNHVSLGTESSLLRVDYNRFDHVLNPSYFRVKPGKEAVHDNEVRIWFSQEYLENIGIRSISPQPEHVTGASDRVIYDFLVAGPEDDISITFEVEPQHIGNLSGRIGLEGGPDYDFQHFIYP